MDHLLTDPEAHPEWERIAALDGRRYKLGTVWGKLHVKVHYYRDGSPYYGRTPYWTVDIYHEASSAGRDTDEYIQRAMELGDDYSTHYEMYSQGLWDLILELETRSEPCGP